jgi:hypothetical protein
MSKSRTELIKEINEARKDAKANLMYVKGLTKMKKKELNEVAKLLKDINNIDDDNDREQEQERLLNEKLEIEKELDELQDEENENEQKLNELNIPDEDENYDDYTEDEQDDLIEIEDEEPLEKEEEEEEPITSRRDYKDIQNELDELNSDNDSDDYVNAEDFLNSVQNKIKEKVSKKVSKKVNDNTDVKKYQNQIKKIMSEFGSKLGYSLKPYQRKSRTGDLTDNDADDLVDLYNDYREDAKYLIDDVLYDMGDDVTLPPKFYDYVNNYFDRQLERVQRVLKI